ncbi:unnamed protein product [Cochlearia groenlandica]
MNTTITRMVSWSDMGDDENLDFLLPKCQVIGPDENEPEQDGALGSMAANCTCDHWTSKCPYKDLAKLSDVFIDKPTTSETRSTSAAPGTRKAAYVSPSMRAGANRNAAGSDMRRRNDENSVRVNNLSDDTREPELFLPFGAVTRVYVAIDQKT